MKIMKSISFAAITAGGALALAVPASAQDVPVEAPAETPPPITVSGSATLISQYRFRGVSQSDEDVAVQAGLTATHESGFHVGTWGSNLAGFGSFGGSNLELDVFGGFKKDLGGVTVDAGLLWYLYPGTNGTDYAEPYASVSGTLGPLSLKAGAAYAPRQDAIGDNDNLYVYTDAAGAIPGTPVTLKGHLGYTTGKGSTLAGPDGHYLDWLVGADISYKMLTLGVAYVDTDIGKTGADAFYTSGTRPGRNIVDGAVLLSVTASF